MPSILTRASSLGPLTTLKGTILISSLTSDIRRPIKRLMEYTVFSGLVIDWRLATWPTSRPPSLAKPTTDGVVRPPSELVMILYITLFHYRHNRIGCSQINSYYFSHMLLLMLN